MNNISYWFGIVSFFPFYMLIYNHDRGVEVCPGPGSHQRPGRGGLPHGQNNAHHLRSHRAGLRRLPLQRLEQTGPGRRGHQPLWWVQLSLSLKKKKTFSLSLSKKKKKKISKKKIFLSQKSQLGAKSKSLFGTLLNQQNFEELS